MSALSTSAVRARSARGRPQRRPPARIVERDRGRRQACPQGRRQRCPCATPRRARAPRFRPPSASPAASQSGLPPCTHGLLQSETLEPRRIALAPSLEAVPAVDDHGPVAIDLVRFFGKLAQRMADRPGKVVLRVLLRRQHLDELRACDQPLEVSRSISDAMSSILRPHVVVLGKVSRQGQRSGSRSGWAARLQGSRRARTDLMAATRRRCTGRPNSRYRPARTARGSRSPARPVPWHRTPPPRGLQKKTRGPGARGGIRRRGTWRSGFASRR